MKAADKSIKMLIAEDLRLMREGHFSSPWWAKKPEDATEDDWERVLMTLYTEVSDQITFESFLEKRIKEHKDGIIRKRKLYDMEQEWLPVIKQRFETASKVAVMDIESFALMVNCRKDILLPLLVEAKTHDEKLAIERAYNSTLRQLLKAGSSDATKKVGLTGPVYDDDEKPSYFL